MKVGGDDVVKNLEEKFKELMVEGNRKVNGSSTLVMFTEEDKYIEDDEEMDEDNYEDNPEDSNTKVKDKEAYFMGTQSQARRRLGKNNYPYCSRPT